MSLLMFVADDDKSLRGCAMQIKSQQKICTVAPEKLKPVCHGNHLGPEAVKVDLTIPLLVTLLLICQSDYHLIPDINISATIGWIVMKPDSYIHVG